MYYWAYGLLRSLMLINASEDLTVESSKCHKKTKSNNIFAFSPD